MLLSKEKEEANAARLGNKKPIAEHGDCFPGYSGEILSFT